MKKIVISSIRECVGKTSIIAGFVTAVNKRFGYIKPLGDRLVYYRKKSWDYDSHTIVKLLGYEGDLESHSENITIGFDHSKLRYMYDEEGIKETLSEMVGDIGRDNDVLFIEGGRDLSFGTSAHLDPLSISKYIDGKVIIIISGDSDMIIDDIQFINKYLNLDDINFGGIVINKVNNIDEFYNNYIPLIDKIGIDVFGVLPYKEELTYFNVGFLAESLFAKVISGEKGLKNIVKNILIGTMSTTNSMMSHSITRDNQLMITSGDRNDIILNSIKSGNIGIILTNNIVPSQNIISKAAEHNIPLLLVPMDTYQVSKRIDEMEALLTSESNDRIKLLAQLIEKNVNIDNFLR
ncbi:MAG: DRTGG domain-containing protein [Spirochaetota bacterium]|nr:DRTGG domain-containing protein [Spirochaetota bacterium]